MQIFSIFINPVKSWLRKRKIANSRSKIERLLRIMSLTLSELQLKRYSLVQKGGEESLQKIAEIDKQSKELSDFIEETKRSLLCLN